MLEEEQGSFRVRTSMRERRRKRVSFSVKILPTRIRVTNETSVPQQVGLEACRGLLVSSWRYIIKGTRRGSMLLPMFSLGQVNTLVSPKTYRQQARKWMEYDAAYWGLKLCSRTVHISAVSAAFHSGHSATL